MPLCPSADGGSELGVPCRWRSGRWISCSA